MPDVFLSPQPNQCILSTHIVVLTRAAQETGVINGNQLTASSPASMVINAASGRIKIAGMPIDTSGDTAILDTAHETLPRIDIIYRDVDGDVNIVKGTPAIIDDPKVLENWKGYTSPQPAADIPAGAILGAVFVSAGATAITSDYIWMFAGGVGDVSTVIATPGVDTVPASEKAVRDGLTTRIAHALATATNDFLVASESGVFVKKTLAEVKTILGLGTAAYTAAIDYAVAAKGVTNGDTHDHQSGRGAAIAVAATVFSATAKILARKTASGGVGEECSLSEILDFIGSATRGDILYRGASAWARLPKGATGQVLIQGANDPIWTTRTFEVPFPFGDGSVVLIAGNCNYKMPEMALKITKAAIRSVDATGAPLSGSITCALYKHARGAVLGTLVDTFAIASATNMEETGLSIMVNAGDWLTIVTSGITTCKQITCTLTLEAT
jgi:hypothetical protein